MTRASAPALALLAACYAPVPPSGARCAANERCPEPLACIAGVCRAPGDDVPPDDAGPPDGPPVLPDAPLACPPGFTKTPFGACHLVVQMPQPWLDAELDCEQRGGHLAVPDTATESIAIAGPAWLGMSDRLLEGTFLTVTGSPLAFQYWASGEPGGANTDCVHTDGMGRWHTGPCGFPFPYVCEYDGRPAVPAAF